MVVFFMGSDICGAVGKIAVIPSDQMERRGSDRRAGLGRISDVSCYPRLPSPVRRCGNCPVGSAKG